MAEKVKVSREVAEFIGSYEGNNGGIPGWEDYLIRDHTESFARNFAGVNEEAMCMKDITPMKLAKMLINGYEIEQTPEEKLASFYHELKRNNASTFEQYESNPFENGIVRGIEEAIRILNLKINGIN